MGKISIVDGTGKYVDKNVINPNMPKRELTISEMTTMSKDELEKYGYKRFDSPEEFMEYKEKEWENEPPKPLTPMQELKWYSIIRKMEEIVDEYRNR